MKPKSIALILYGDSGSPRDAFTEDNYKELANGLSEAGFNVETVLYHCSKADKLITELERFDTALSWVNPRERTERGADNLDLDDVLRSISQKGVYVSTHPEIIMKIGTKKVLYSTRDMSWSTDIELYSGHEDFEKRFLNSPDSGGMRILKKLRGESGRGIFKVSLEGDKVRVVHAASDGGEQLLSKDEFHAEFRQYFENGGLMVSQQWVGGITNGMVRCYITGTKVSGFGYQETVALCPGRQTSKRFYYSEDCGLFQDLRGIMEAKWIPQIQEIHSISDEMMPLLWDVDLFINDVNTAHTEKKYTLCEINVSCVSPFPPSCVKHIVRELKGRLV
jgi:glutathione synthase/RimK-type ligase-like ATP-grasp enzyme